MSAHRSKSAEGSRTLRKFLASTAVAKGTTRKSMFLKLAPGHTNAMRQRVAIVLRSTKANRCHAISHLVWPPNKKLLEAQNHAKSRARYRVGVARPCFNQ